MIQQLRGQLPQAANGRHCIRPQPPRSHRLLCSATQPAKKEVVVGIDLGTTNSAVACLKKGKPVCLPNKHGDTLTPSVVHYGPNDQVVVGKEAKKLPAETTFYSVKRLIGRAYADPVVQEEQQRLAYQVASDEDGSVVLTCPTASAGYLYPEEVSACVLSQLLQDAAAATGADAITKAVITVPAYFNDDQREATITAGRLAGLEVARLIREPVAAALAYGLDLKEDQVVLVFDLGGGTYDISLLEVGNGTVEVLSTGGDPHLGGDDWDALIVTWLQDNYLKPAGVDCSSPTIAARLKGLAEYAKVQLSDNPQVVLRMPVGGPDGGPLSVTLTQQQLDQLSQQLFTRARLPLDQACWQAGVDLNEVMVEYQKNKERLARKGAASWKQELLKMEIRPKQRAAVSKVLLVGGATRMPAVQRFITNMTGLQPEGAVVDPDEAVALGAGVQAGILQGEVQDMMVMDQWQASLMRALAQLQLKSNDKVKDKLEQRYDMEEMEEEVPEEAVVTEEEAAEQPQQQQQRQSKRRLKRGKQRGRGTSRKAEQAPE